MIGQSILAHMCMVAKTQEKNSCLSKFGGASSHTACQMAAPRDRHDMPPKLLTPLNDTLNPSTQHNSKPQ